MSSHSVFSHGLDELAKASSTLLDHSTATSSDRMADHQQLPELVSRTKSHNQAQFNQAPGQQSQTLHFKVVQTSHRDEPSSLSQNQDYVQQVFTVQQQQRQKTGSSFLSLHSSKKYFLFKIMFSFQILFSLTK